MAGAGFNNYQEMEDDRRVYHITSYVCYQCGEKLRMSYEKPLKQRNAFDEDANSEPKPAGGTLAKEEQITIHPCKTCYKPFREFNQALNNLVKAQGNT